MKFGENLKKLRKASKMSQEALAEKVNVSRQSVSKWENSESYPEMNNILELCKIFHCNINDLVNDGIIDLDSLDDEIKMNMVKFKKEQQNKMKGLSKTISIIALIAKIAVLISIPIIIATMLILAFITERTNIKNNEITFKGIDDKIIIEERNNNTYLKLNDKIITDKEEQNIIIKVKKILENNSKIVILGYLETGLIFLIIDLALVGILLNHLEKLFNNINKGDTPFTLENVKHIKKMAYLMIAIIILPNIAGVIFEIILNTELNIGFEMFTLIEILFLFSMAYIFEYGYYIQLDSKGRMYGEYNE